MNPTNDPLIEVTQAELDCILRSRKGRGLHGPAPRAAPEFSGLPSTCRAWYVAEFIQQAKAAQRMNDSELANSWRDGAQAIASAIAQEANADLMRLVADALDGKHPPGTLETRQQRVLRAINNFCGEQKRMPSRRELIGLGLRGEDITEVVMKCRIKLHPEKRGPKPK